MKKSYHNRTTDSYEIVYTNISNREMRVIEDSPIWSAENTFRAFDAAGVYQNCVEITVVPDSMNAVKRLAITARAA